jgi:hypothetical protein
MKGLGKAIGLVAFFVLMIVVLPGLMIWQTVYNTPERQDAGMVLFQEDAPDRKAMITISKDGQEVRIGNSTSSYELILEIVRRMEKRQEKHDE